jgi:alpha-L-rhamnosidase
MVNQGFTSLPESWDARPGTGNSMNHFMLGHLMEWHYAYLAGIRQQPGSVGWKRVLIAPTPGSLESAAAVFRSPSGRIDVSWKQTKSMFTMKVVIPKGVDATAMLPNGEQKALKPGVTTLRSSL